MVGFCVGVTGVGAGSLMTPILILLLKVEPHIAIGTDLLYAAVSKFFGSMVHIKKLNVVWPVVLWLAAGSIPASIGTNLALSYVGGGDSVSDVLTLALGVMLTLTGVSIIFRKQLERFFMRFKTVEPTKDEILAWPKKKLVIMGIVLGVLVTLSSVGAGAFGMMALVLMFQHLPMIRIIGSDVMHAVLLTFVAGMGHLFNGNVDFVLLGWLLVGSVPAIIFGTLVATKLPEDKIRPILGLSLLLIGISFVFKVL